MGVFHVTVAVNVPRSAMYSSLAGPTQDEKDGGRFGFSSVVTYFISKLDGFIIGRKIVFDRL